jgi:hypothetical protein
MHPPQSFEHYFGMAKAKKLKIRCRGHFQWYDLPADFHEKLSGSKVISGGQKVW